MLSEMNNVLFHLALLTVGAYGLVVGSVLLSFSFGSIVLRGTSEGWIVGHL